MTSSNLNLRLPSTELHDDVESIDDEAVFPREVMNKLILNYFVTGILSSTK